MYIRIPQNPFTDTAVGVTVVIGEIVTLMQTMYRVGEGNLTSECGLDLRYSESANKRLVKRHSKGELTQKSS